MRPHRSLLHAPCVRKGSHRRHCALHEAAASTCFFALWSLLQAREVYCRVRGSSSTSVSAKSLPQSSGASTPSPLSLPFNWSGASARATRRMQVSQEFTPYTVPPLTSTPVIPCARELGIGIVAYSPLCRGLLTGAVNPAALPATDRRSANPRFSAEKFSANMAACAQPLANIAGVMLFNARACCSTPAHVVQRPRVR